MTVDTKRNYDYPSFNLCVAAALLTISMHGTVSAQDQGTAPRRTAPYIPQRPSTGIGTAFQEIARGKPATQQSTEGLPFGRPASEAKMYQASLAVDGKIETFSQTQKGVYINRGLGSTNDGVADKSYPHGGRNWWKVDLQDNYRISHISVQFPQQYADGYEGMVVSLNPGQKGESFVSTVQDYVKGKLAYDFNVNRNGHTVFILAGIAPLRLAEVKVYGEKLGPRSIDDDGKVYLKSVNGDVAGGVTRGTLRNVVQVGKRGMAYHISNEVGKEYRGELKYNMSSTIWSGVNKQTGLAITDGPYWNSYLEKRNASNPSQRWIIERAPGSYVSSDGIVKNGDKVYVRRDTKAGESKIYLRTKSDGVLGLTNKENERTAFTIQEAP